MKSQQKVGKRLVAYALSFKKTILVALVLLTVAVTAELVGPFIAKKVIDDHIMGIEEPWFEVAEETEQTVMYEGNLYKRSSYVSDEDVVGEGKLQLLQVGRSFYAIEEHLMFDGERVVEGSVVTIRSGNEQVSYEAEQLATATLIQFYQPEIRPIIVLLAVYVALLIFAAFFQYGKSLLLQKAANRIIQKMRTDVFEHIQRLPITYFDNQPAGRIVSRVTNDTEAIRELYVKVLASFVTSGIYMIGIFVALFILDVYLALVTLAVVPIIIVWVIVYRKLAAKYNYLIRTKISEINGMINETIQGMPIIRAFRRQKQMTAEFEQLNKEHFTYENKLLSLNA